MAAALAACGLVSFIWPSSAPVISTGDMPPICSADVLPAPALLALDVEDLLGEVCAFHGRSPGLSDVGISARRPARSEPQHVGVGRDGRRSARPHHRRRCADRSCRAISVGEGLASGVTRKSMMWLRTRVVERVLVHVGARALLRQRVLDDLGEHRARAVGHQHDAVGEIDRLVDVVGDHEHGLAGLLADAAHLVLQRAAGERVERARTARPSA